MYCPKCGSYNPDNSYTCSACGTNLQQPNTNPNINQNIPNNQQNNQYGPNNQQNTHYIPNYQPINQNVPNYLVFSILVTIFCCLPLGIVAIVNSTSVDKKLRMGDYNGAVDASKKAKTFCLISLIIGIVWEAIYFFIILAQM